MTAEGIESSTEDETLSPLMVAVAALVLTDERTLFNTTLRVSKGGEVQISMHGHDWSAVAQMIDRLKLPRRPQSMEQLGQNTYVTRFRYETKYGDPDVRLGLHWFHDWL